MFVTPSASQNDKTSPSSASPSRTFLLRHDGFEEAKSLLRRLAIVAVASLSALVHPRQQRSLLTEWSKQCKLVDVTATETLDVEQL